MNPWRFILFGLIILSFAVASAQQVHTYLDRRWLQEGESLRVIVTIRGGIPLATPEFPEIPGFSLGQRSTSTQKQGASRITNYQQEYLADTTGTFVVAPVVVPLPNATLRESPGAVSVRPKELRSMSGYAPAPLDARLTWELSDSTLSTGQILNARLYLEIDRRHVNNMYWDLGGLAEMADSLRRCPGGEWILRDSVFQSMNAPMDAPDGKLRYLCYSVWLGTVSSNLQELAASRFRIQRRWNRTATYRGSRNLQPRWQDEFLSIDALSWSVLSPPDEIPRPASPGGPLHLSTSWTSAQLNTGESLTLEIRIEGEVFMGLVPAPGFDIPESIVLRGPEMNTHYQLTDTGLIGTKTLSYALYPARPGSYLLQDARLYWVNPVTGQVDSSRADMPELSVRGEEIYQLLEQNAIERFYDQRVMTANDQALPDKSWISWSSWILLFGAFTIWGTTIRFHYRDKQRKRRQELKSKRFPGR